MLSIAKKALHTSIPSTLPCRESEIDTVRDFLIKHISEKIPGSLYISGAPGTGKTAVVHHVLESLYPTTLSPRKKGQSGGTGPAPFHKIYINCMNVGNPGFVFELIGNQLKLGKMNATDLKEKIKSRCTSKVAKPMVIVLDEMDQLLTTRGNEFLYSLFEITQLPNSKLILVGVANSLDLITRHLPKVATTKSSSPSATRGRKRGSAAAAVDVDTQCQLLHFPPYEREHIVQILQNRLASVESEVFDQMAIKLVAAKVAASTGDIRKALNACKTALESMDKQERAVLKPTTENGPFVSSPKKGTPRKVGIGSVSKILAPHKDESGLPLQQLLILATLLRIHLKAQNTKNVSFNGVDSAIPISSVYAEYQTICNTKGYEFIDMSDMISIFGMLEDRSLITIWKAPGTPTSASKRGFKKSKKEEGIYFDPKAIEFILRNEDFLNSIINT